MKLSAICLALCLVAGVSARAHADGIKVDNAWARATMAGTANGAAYATVTNTGTAPDKLIGVSTDVAAKAELHQSVNQDGVMKMLPVPSLEVKPGQKVELKPGSFHIMLFGLKGPLTAGQNFSVTLEFEKAGKQQVEVEVAAAHHDMGDMKDMKDMPGMSH